MRFVVAILTMTLAVLVLPTESMCQARLVSFVVGSGGNVAVSSSTGNVALSSTVGQTFISAAKRSETSVLWEGFWTPFAQQLVGVDDEGPVAADGIQAFPNPMSYSGRITFGEVLDGDITLRLYDLVGTQVKTVMTSISIAGEQSIAISTADDTGAMLPAGAYLCVVEGRTATGKTYKASARIQIVH